MADPSKTTARWVHAVWPEEMSEKAGWYPVLVCWDASEGFFPHGGQWTGSEWKALGPVSAYWPKAFTDEKTAEEFAREHDPNW